MTRCDIFVVIATCNGAERLGRVLGGYANQVDPGVSWAIAIVDNASTDNTREVINSFKGRLPIFDFVEPVAGKNRALNTVLREIKASILVFSDDDAIPDADFLVGWSRVLGSFQDYDLFGGKVVPLFQVDPPRWLDPAVLPFDILFAANDRAEGELPPADIFGPNMAVRGHVFEKGVRFDETIGPNSADAFYTMGSETELCVRLAGQGAKCFFLEGPKVQHIIRPNQMTLEFVQGRARRIGRGYARLLHRDDDRPKLDIPGLRFLPHTIRQGLRWIQKSLSIGSSRMRREWHYYLQIGYYDELRARYR